MPVRPPPVPKPALRSAFPLQENKNLTNNEDGEGEKEIKGLAQLKKAFEAPSGQVRVT